MVEARDKMYSLILTSVTAVRTLKMNFLVAADQIWRNESDYRQQHAKALLLLLLDNLRNGPKPNQTHGLQCLKKLSISEVITFRQQNIH